jgi:hypothetical protein
MLVRFLGVAAVLTVGVWLFTASGRGAGEGQNLVWKPVMDEDDASKLAKRSVAIIQEDVDTLTKNVDPVTNKKLTKPQSFKIRKRILANAGFLAVYAKAAKPGANKQELITLAEIGLKLNKAAQDRKAKPADLAKLAKELANAKVNAKAKVDIAKWTDCFEDVDYVMTPFKTWEKGGNGLPKALQSTPRLKTKNNGIEEKIKALAKTGVRDIKKEGPDIALMAKEVAAIAQLAEGMCPVEMKEGDKDPKEWVDWSQQMRKIALDLAAAAKKGDANQVKTLSKKLDNNCVACHKPFKSS